MKLKKVAAVLLTATMLSAMAAGCGKNTIDQNAVAATFNDKEVSMGVANFVAQYQAVQYDSYFLSYYGEDMWSSDDGSGGTMTDTVKDGVMENLEEMYLLDAHVEDYDISLTEEEKQAITDAAAKFLSDNSADAIQAMGATQENVEEMLRLNTIRSKMKAAIEETIDTEVSEEEMAQKTFSYVVFEAADDSDEDTEETEDTGDEDTGDEAEETAESGQADNEVEAGTFLAAVSKPKNLETVAESNGYTVETCSYGESDLDEDGNSTSLPVAVLEAADKLKDGKMVSEPVEADGAYYVIRMDNTDDKDAAEVKKESILDKRRSDKFDEALEGYKNESDWTVNEEEWNKVSFDELYTIASSESEESTDTESADDTEATDTDAATE